MMDVEEAMRNLEATLSELPLGGPEEDFEALTDDWRALAQDWK